MSRIGNAPIVIPDKVSANVKADSIEVKGPNGTLNTGLLAGVAVEVKDGQIVVSRTVDSPETRSQHGLVRSLINNMVQGVLEGFSKTLEINGVGYRAELKGKELILSLGFSHPVNFTIPDGIEVKVNKQTELIISGIDRQLVGETSARIRRLRPPEPYKGKGIKYSDEVIKRKAGKSAA